MCTKKIKKFPMEIVGWRLPIDLTILDMSNFDVILGMDWLSSYHVTLDCHAKEVSLFVPGPKRIQFRNAKKVIPKPSKEFPPVRLIFALKAWKSVINGAQAFLVLIAGVQEEEKKLETIPVICEYQDVFPEELPGLPLVREIEFEISLVPDTTPLSKAP